MNILEPKTRSERRPFRRDVTAAHPRLSVLLAKRRHVRRGHVDVVGNRDDQQIEIGCQAAALLVRVEPLITAGGIGSWLRQLLGHQARELERREGAPWLCRRSRRHLAYGVADRRSWTWRCRVRMRAFDADTGERLATGNAAAAIYASARPRKGFRCHECDQRGRVVVSIKWGDQ